MSKQPWHRSELKRIHCYCHENNLVKYSIIIYKYAHVVINYSYEWSFSSSSSFFSFFEVSSMTKTIMTTTANNRLTRKRNNMHIKWYGPMPKNRNWKHSSRTRLVLLQHQFSLVVFLVLVLVLTMPIGWILWWGNIHFMKSQ